MTRSLVFLTCRSLVLALNYDTSLLEVVTAVVRLVQVILVATGDGPSREEAPAAQESGSIAGAFRSRVTVTCPPNCSESALHPRSCSAVEATPIPEVAVDKVQ